GHPNGFFDEFMLEVDDQADDIDSTAWAARQSIPPTDEELRGYERLDSLKNLPVPIGRRLLQAVGASFFVVMGLAPDFYRFNRVEGAYFGGTGTVRPLRRLDVRLTGGYGIRTERVQWGLGATYRLHEGRRLDVGFDAFDRVRRRPTIVRGESHFSSGTALGWGIDAADYFRAEGFDAFVATKLVKFSRLRLTYHDELHFSLPLGTDNTLFEIDDPVRDNPPIDDGKLRSLEAQLRIDNRPMFKRKGRAEILGAVEYWRLTLGAEHASPDLIDNDFDFTRYYASLYRRQRTLGLGLTSIHLYAGASDGNLPPQRYYVIDFGDAVFFNTLGYNTLHESIFAGNRLYSISFDHNFRRYLFVKSGLPLIRDIPLWLSLHGSMFWSEFRNHTPQPGDETLSTARKSYQELGFGIGNLTPFMMPFNFAVNFTWQLSDYDTSDFTWFLKLEL
ncbi:MAG TPA: hypothetical protein VM118_05920, partial [Acidobacteriota bacterium]|nr:hypothetical protein [Acidobacteriota bacterium]